MALKITSVDTRLTAKDGHTFYAYVAEPEAPLAAIVVIQEIFGVNHHIRSVADDFAREGYYTIAPALFDRVERDVELPYDAESSRLGMGMAKAIDVDAPLEDINATLDHARQRIVSDRVGVVGYCWGGSIAWLAAARLDVAAAVAYYGGQIANYADEVPQAPIMLHFGEQDKHITAADRAKIHELQPRVPIYLYDAGHGFNCSERDSYNAEAAALARSRTLDFYREHLLNSRNELRRGA